MTSVPGDDRRIILVLDGEPEDRAAIAEAARVTGGAGAHLLVLFVPVRMAEWAHLELGDDPALLRRQIEWEQYQMAMQMLDDEGVDAAYRMKHLTSRWRLTELQIPLARCDRLIVSTASRLVRHRLTRLARHRKIPLSLTRRARPSASPAGRTEPSGGRAGM